MSSLSNLSGEVWVHTQLDRAISNAEKNRVIPVENQSERRSSQSRRSRNGSVRFHGITTHETASQHFPARTLLHSKKQSNQVLAYTKRYRESLHSKSGNQCQQVGEVEPGKVNELNDGIQVEWARLCQTITQKPDSVLTKMMEDINQSLGQVLTFK